jgi:DNA-binding response OmpR family regulator
MARILLVDDEPDFSELAREYLEAAGHAVEWLDDP